MLLSPLGRNQFCLLCAFIALFLIYMGLSLGFSPGPVVTPAWFSWGLLSLKKSLVCVRDFTFFWKMTLDAPWQIFSFSRLLGHLPFACALCFGGTLGVSCDLSQMHHVCPRAPGRTAEQPKHVVVILLLLIFT